MKILIMNGPAGSGKDEAVRVLVEQRGAFPFSFKRKLIEITCSIYDIPVDVWMKSYTREWKEAPNPQLRGLTPRQALIKVSEEVIKPVYGKTFFGEVEAANILKHQSLMPSVLETSACSDGGFAEEVEPLVDAFGQENVYIIKIHRPGHSFEGDSRSWIESDRILDDHYINIYNESSVEEFRNDILALYDYLDLA